MDANQETLDDSIGIIALAVQHGLLSEANAERIRAHATENDMSLSDSAVSMGLITANHFEALRHLQRPLSLSPDYELKGLVGVGANGVVFRATQVKLSREVALKTINASRLSDGTSLKRIQREATLIAQLSHPNIVTAHDCGFHNNHFYIAMELVQGQDLLDYILQRGKIPEQECWLLVRQIALALDYANQSNLIHRDIKPANVLVTTQAKSSSEKSDLPVCKVVDFGLAYQSAGTDSSKLTAEGNTLGTPSYVAPEQLTDSSVDLRADIYSLGATAFHLLSGYPPFADSSVMNTIIAKTTGDDRWRDELHPAVSGESARLIQDMTEFDPQKRIQTYEELLQRIDEIASPLGSEGQAKPAPGHGRPNTAVGGGVRKTMVMIVVGFLVAVSGWFTFQAFRGKSGDNTNTAPASVSALEYVRTGHSVYLFDGKNAPSYRKSGLWIPTTGSEGRVLKGKSDGWILFPLEHENVKTDAVELELGVILSEGSAAVLELPPDEHGQTWVLSVGQGRAAVVASTDESKVLGTPIEFRSNSESPVKRVQLLRIGDQITVLFRGKMLASVKCPVSGETTIRLVAKFGDVELADIMLTGLTPP